VAYAWWFRGGQAHVPNLDRVERLPDASHWVHHDKHERVTQLLIDFFAPARATKDRETPTK
jgi:pimeloyl-ACP methyl ester carboxylesterase